MNKIRTLFFLMAMALLQPLFSQSYTLKFTATTNAGRYVRMSTVYVENVTRSWTMQLSYPDTVLTFTITGIDGANNGLAKTSTYPNPFNGNTNVVVGMPQSGNASIAVHTTDGQTVAERTMQLESGDNLFSISLKNKQMYLLTITTPQGRKTLKLFNIGSASGNSIAHLGLAQTSTKRQCDQPIQIGDELKIHASTMLQNGTFFNSNETRHTVTSNQNITLLFDAVLPTVYATAASNLGTTSVSSGGQVVDDGDGTITARGVCWSTSSSPTIQDAHTTDGTGSGTFTSSVTNLRPFTYYYLKAYATNAAGTAYSMNVVTFRTMAPANTFAVSSNKLVYLAPGNLQWSATNGGSSATTHAVAGGGTAAGTWRFAPHQWDVIGNANYNISSSYSGWIDLFGWGTSGYHNSADQYNTRYFPYSKDTSTVHSNNGYGYGPSINMTDTNLVGTSARYDWGVYNAIYNPKTSSTDAPGTWRTLTNDEWQYLLFNRNTPSGKRVAKATVNNVKGLIIFPDNWNTSTYAISDYSTQANFSANVISSSQWTTLENAGCVFLPAAGYRTNTSISYVDYYGYYWSATAWGSTAARRISFEPAAVSVPWNGLQRRIGLSVRLAKDYQ